MDYRQIAVWVDGSHTLTMDESFFKTHFFTARDVILFLRRYPHIRVCMDISPEMPSVLMDNCMQVLRADCMNSLWLKMRGNNDLEAVFFSALAACSRLKTLKLDISWQDRRENHPCRYVYPKYFQYLPNLTELDISHNIYTHSRSIKYGDSFIAGFSHLAKLETLTLCDFFIRDEEEAVALIEMLPLSAPLKDVTLHHLTASEFSFHHTDFLTRDHSLQQPIDRLMRLFPRIKTLYLGGFHFNNFNSQSIYDSGIVSFSFLKYLSLHTCQFDPAITYDHLRAVFSNLEGLSLYFGRGSAPGRVKELSSVIPAADFIRLFHSSLLEIDECCVTSEVIEAIAKNPELRILIINGWGADKSRSDFLQHLNS